MFKKKNIHEVAKLKTLTIKRKYGVFQVGK